MTEGQQVMVVIIVFCIAGAEFWVGYYFGGRAREKLIPPPAAPAAAEPPVKLPLPPSLPPLIFGEHHFIQFSANEYHKVEPWCLCRYDMKDQFWCSTESEARQLMERADAYRSAH